MSKSITRKLMDAQKRMQVAGEQLERATWARDQMVMEAIDTHGMSVSEVGRVLGVRRETAHYAAVRARGRVAANEEGVFV